MELVNYVRPLIKGEVSLKYDNGVPVYMEVMHLRPGVIPGEDR
jgi:6-phosphofructokinase 1